VTHLATQLRELQADFQRIADRANWVRAVFTVQAGRFGMFLLGASDVDGTSAGLVRGVKSVPELAIISELYALTEQAGAIAAEIVQSGRYPLKVVSTKSVHYDLRAFWEFWLMILLHTSPSCVHCRANGADGTDRVALPQLGDEAVAIRIDGYPQVCVSALAWLKARSPASAGGLRARKKPSRLPNAKRDAWVAQQRKKNPPPSWEMIYDEAVRLAETRCWTMPRTPKGLEEAYRRYLKRERTRQER
jgi:hypothetical protein